MAWQGGQAGDRKGADFLLAFSMAKVIVEVH